MDDKGQRKGGNPEQFFHDFRLSEQWISPVSPCFNRIQWRSLRRRNRGESRENGGYSMQSDILQGVARTAGRRGNHFSQSGKSGDCEKKDHKGLEYHRIPCRSITRTILLPTNAANKSSTSFFGSLIPDRNSFSGMPFRPACWMSIARRSESGISFFRSQALKVIKVGMQMNSDFPCKHPAKRTRINSNQLECKRSPGIGGKLHTNYYFIWERRAETTCQFTADTNLSH